MCSISSYCLLVTLLTLQTCICILAKRSRCLSMHHWEPLFSFTVTITITHNECRCFLSCWPPSGNPIIPHTPSYCWPLWALPQRSAPSGPRPVCSHCREVCLSCSNDSWGFMARRTILAFDVVDQKSWWISPFDPFKTKYWIKDFPTA